MKTWRSDHTVAMLQLHNTDMDLSNSCPPRTGCLTQPLPGGACASRHQHTAGASLYTSLLQALQQLFSTLSTETNILPQLTGPHQGVAPASAGSLSPVVPVLISSDSELCSDPSSAWDFYSSSRAWCKANAWGSLPFLRLC